MQEIILDYLKRKQEYISGEELSAHLKISRQALWKHMQELRQIGYNIVAVPHLGYKLESCPDRLFPSEISFNLDTKFVGRKIYYFDCASSTMDIATELGMQGASTGTLVLAEAQTKGKGRLGRTWSSPKYKGIYLSLILRPKILPNQTSIFTLLCAISICEAIKKITGLEAKIKWPNDILIYNKKLGGILTELNAEMDRVRFIVMGIGLNINNDKKTLISGATSLKEYKKENVNRIELLKELLRKIEMNYLTLEEKGPKIITDKWRNFSITLGRRVKVICLKEELQGQALDIDIDGGLLLRNDLGLIQKVTSGDVVHCR